MSDKPISTEFSAKAGERELEIFLLSKEARKEFRKGQERDASELARLRIEQQERRAEDVRKAKLEISAEQMKPELTPKPEKRRKVLKDEELQVVSEHRVDTQNRVVQEALAHRHREREDADLARHKEERLLREAQDRSATRDDKSLSLKKDFDHSR